MNENKLDPLIGTWCFDCPANPTLGSYTAILSRTKWIQLAFGEGTWGDGAHKVVRPYVMRWPLHTTIDDEGYLRTGFKKDNLFSKSRIEIHNSDNFLLDLDGRISHYWRVAEEKLPCWFAEEVERAVGRFDDQSTTTS